MDPKETVRAGYGAIAESYTAGRAEASADVQLLDDLVFRIPRGGRVLDAGCGGGKPVGRSLSSAFRVVGLDVARAQLRLFQSHVPSGDAVLGDMARLPFDDAAFDGIASLYAIIHVPREEHRGLLGEFRRVLRPSGVALLCMGEVDLPADISEYMGTRMYWSHFDAETNRRMLAGAGFRILSDRSVVDFQEPSAAHRFFLVMKADSP